MAYYDEDRYIPPRKLDENRSFVKFLLLSIVTLGIYDIVFFISLSYDIDKIATRQDGKKTMNYLFVVLLSLVTFSIVQILWHHEVAARVQGGLENSESEYKFGTSDFWLWFMLGSFILVGRYVYAYKLIRAMNILSKEYNARVEEEEKKHKPKYW